MVIIVAITDIIVSSSIDSNWCNTIYYSISNNNANSNITSAKAYTTTNIKLTSST